MGCEKRIDVNVHFAKDHLTDVLLELLAELKGLKALGAHIMSAISDFAVKQNAFNDRMDKAVAGLQGDIVSLNETIKTLQNSPGTITPEDQASLDTIQVRAQTIADKLDALDALTPPVPPTA
jgi:hypothetical protein